MFPSVGFGLGWRKEIVLRLKKEVMKSKGSRGRVWKNGPHSCRVGGARAGGSGLKRGASELGRPHCGL